MDAGSAPRPEAATIVRHVGESGDSGGVLVVQDGRRNAHSLDWIARSVPVPATIWKVPSARAALQLIQRRPAAFGLLVVHDALRSMDPVEFVRRARDLVPGLPAILVSAEGAGALLVASEVASPPSHFLGAGVVRTVWHRLRGKAPAF